MGRVEFCGLLRPYKKERNLQFMQSIKKARFTIIFLALTVGV